MRTLILCLVLLGLSFPAFATDRVVDAVHQLDPNAVVERSPEQPFHDFTLVNVRGQTLLVSSDGRYVVQGELFDLAKHRDISEDVRATLRSAAIAKIPVSERIVFRAPHERHRVIVFFDPECPFCRQLMGHTKAYQDLGITFEVLAFPRNGLDSSAYQRAESIWCSADRAKALIASLSAPLPSSPACGDAVKRQFQLAEYLAVPGTPTLLDVRGHYLGGYLTPQQLEAILDSKHGWRR